MPSRYAVFGFILSSEISMPYLAKAPESGIDCDVTIRRGAAPTQLEGAFYKGANLQVSPGAVLLSVDGFRILITDGREIVVDAPASVSDNLIRLYLLGTGMASICHQRGLFPFHACVIRVGDGAVAIAGRSGAGKSTLAAFFANSGYEIWGDDLCVLTPTASGDLCVSPGVARVKLDPNTLKALSIGAAGLEPVAEGVDKLSLPLPTFCEQDRVKLGRIYILDQGQSQDDPLIQRLHGIHAASAVLDNVYRPEIGVLIRPQSQLDQALQVASGCEVFSLNRKLGLDRLSLEAEVLRNHLCAQPGS